MARMTPFLVDDAFPLAQVHLEDRRFMSRLDPEAWESQVQALMGQIAHEGQMSPVGVAKLMGEYRYVVIYGYTRTAAIARLGWTTIRANVYEEIDETTARILNAGDNAWHIQLTDWERALQMHKLRAIGTPVESSNGARSLMSLFGMSKRTIFNWLGIVNYDLPALHQAIAEKKLGLQHALVFRDYPPEVSAAWIERCIDGEWSSRELKLRLSAVDAPPDDRATMHGISSQSAESSATLHEGVASESSHERATMHGMDDAVHPQLAKAGRYLLQVTQQQISDWEPEEQQAVKEALRQILQVIAHHPPA
jgi:ParB/Sulfiredoxin domain